MEGTWNLDRRRRYGRTAACNLDLGAADVELRRTGWVWVVDPQGLNTQQVLAVLNALGDRGGVGC